MVEWKPLIESSVVTCVTVVTVSFTTVFLQTHYYQPMWTLVGAGIKTTAQSSRAQSKCIPNKADWIKQYVEGFEPDKNAVLLGDGKKVCWE